jgi:hypothetical protein
VLQKIEHVLSGSVSLNVKAIHLALEVKTFLDRLYTYDGSQYGVQPSVVWTSHS